MSIARPSTEELVRKPYVIPAPPHDRRRYRPSPHRLRPTLRREGARRLAHAALPVCSPTSAALTDLASARSGSVRHQTRIPLTDRRHLGPGRPSCDRRPPTGSGRARDRPPRRASFHRRPSRKSSCSAYDLLAVRTRIVRRGNERRVRSAGVDHSHVRRTPSLRPHGRGSADSKTDTARCCFASLAGTTRRAEVAAWLTHAARSRRSETETPPIPVASRRGAPPGSLRGVRPQITAGATPTLVGHPGVSFELRPESA